MPVQHLPILIYQKYHWLTGFITNYLKDSPWPDLSRPQIVILGGIYQGESKAIRLAEMIGISRQAVYKSLKELEARGLVVQKQNPKQLNSAIIELSDEGQACIDYVDNMINTLEENLVKQHGKSKVEAVMEILKADWTVAL